MTLLAQCWGCLLFPQQCVQRHGQTQGVSVSGGAHVSILHEMLLVSVQKKNLAEEQVFFPLAQLSEQPGLTSN